MKPEPLLRRTSHRVLETRWTAPEDGVEAPGLPQDATEWLRTALAVVAHPDVASKEPIVRQYDHTVQGTAAAQPFGGPDGDSPGDAAVMTPLPVLIKRGAVRPYFFCCSSPLVCSSE